MGKKIVLGVIVFFLLVLAMVILKSKWVMQNQFIQNRMAMMEQRGMQMMKMEQESLRMAKTLAGGQWMWEMTVGDDKKVVKPKTEGVFGLEFEADGKLSMMTDCNNSTGTYKVTGENLAVGEFVGTKKYCEGSQEESFAKMVLGAASYALEEDGTLVIQMADDGGAMYFERAAEPVM